MGNRGGDDLAIQPTRGTELVILKDKRQRGCRRAVYRKGPARVSTGSETGRFRSAVLSTTVIVILTVNDFPLDAEFDT